MENIKEVVKSIPYFNENAGEIYEKLKKTKEILMKRHYLDNHQFCRKRVSGLWVFTHLTFEGAPQILVRTEVPLGSYERLLLHGELFDLIGQDVVYDYQVDIVEGTSMIKGLKEELIKEMEAKRILTIYDNERDVIK